MVSVLEQSFHNWEIAVLFGSFLDSDSAFENDIHLVTLITLLENGGASR
jgi:hypothetical protein